MLRETAQNLPDRRPLAWLLSLMLIASALLLARPAASQELDPAALEELVAPVALYPDDVLGIILPAAAFPLDIVRAARFLEELENDPTLEPDPEWDDSVVALLNYPEVLRMMDADIDWTWELGEAVLTDQAAVLAAAQSFRGRAYAAGNLRSDDRQTMTADDGAIAIKPADPEVVYIPIYEPREVVVFHTAPIWHYYPTPYPLYYYPYPYGYSFNVGYFWGVTSYFSIGWHSHYVHVHHHTHYAHPYYLNSYYSYAPYYPRSHVNITVAVNNYDNVWQPGPRRGNRPEMVTVEGRTSAARTARSVSTETQANRAARASTTDSSGARNADARTLMAPGSSGAAAGTNRAATSQSTRQGTRQAPTRQGNTPQTSRPSPAPEGSARATPDASTTQPPARATTRTSPSTSTRTEPQSTSRTTPQGATRTVPQSSTRSISPRGTQTAPTPTPATRPQTAAPRSTDRSAASTPSPMRSAAPSGTASSPPRAQGTTRSGGDRTSSSASRQSQR